MKSRQARQVNAIQRDRIRYGSNGPHASVLVIPHGVGESIGQNQPTWWKVWAYDPAGGGSSYSEEARFAHILPFFPSYHRCRQ